MQKQLNPIIVIVAVVIMVIGIGFIGYRSVQPPTPAPGSYTPGVPPWLDKNSKDYGKASPYNTGKR